MTKSKGFYTHHYRKLIVIKCKSILTPLRLAIKKNKNVHETWEKNQGILSASHSQVLLPTRKKRALLKKRKRGSILSGYPSDRKAIAHRGFAVALTLHPVNSGEEWSHSRRHCFPTTSDRLYPWDPGHQQKTPGWSGWVVVVGVGVGVGVGAERKKMRHFSFWTWRQGQIGGSEGRHPGRQGGELPPPSRWFLGVTCAHRQEKEKRHFFHSLAHSVTMSSCSSSRLLLLFQLPRSHSRRGSSLAGGAVRRDKTKRCPALWPGRRPSRPVLCSHYCPHGAEKSQLTFNSWLTLQTFNVNSNQLCSSVERGELLVSSVSSLLVSPGMCFISQWVDLSLLTLNIIVLVFVDYWSYCHMLGTFGH